MIKIKQRKKLSLKKIDYRKVEAAKGILKEKMLDPVEEQRKLRKEWD